ncbi:uncharacterized protein LOC121257676 isoform X2 [Juglans microcarpa x Juglans regia]|uniref:uncharacterized protein LOC121257676 isoform X2 n=1 Tax=Juglans microcarpa x Juglans regia TaxID=2249226 RepID=UPI001B7F5093|nr:uncharacterized protein LOC121257676 isoform X2 [Juglans microcarpa x Juglans regia]
MGKIELQNLHRQQNHEADSNQGSSGFFCDGCSVALNRVGREFSFKCFFVLILTLSVLVSGIFWVLPFHSTKCGFDAKDAIKLGATVQAYFRLDKPVTKLAPHIRRLEYDIYGEIGVPGIKVAIISMHQSGASNWTDVVFGVLSDPINVPISPVSLSLLRSSLIELFLQHSNLTLTSSIFGKTTMFQILKFPRGLTIIPVQFSSIWQIPQILFNFTLNNSISDILEDFIEFKDQLKIGLYLRSYESVYVQITNDVGSTIAPPVTVQASVMSDLGSLLPQRLKQLAETIKGSPAQNLGLDNTVFGKVKSISLSSYLKGTINATPPSPSPSPFPSPEPSNYPSISPYPALSPLTSPMSSPNIKHRSPAPSMVIAHPPRPFPYQGFRNSPSLSPSHYNPTVPSAFSPLVSTPNAPPTGPTSQLSPGLSPIPEVSYAPSPRQDKGSAEGLSPSLAPSPSSLAAVTSYQQVWLLGFSGLWIFCLFCWLA